MVDKTRGYTATSTLLSRSSFGRVKNCLFPSFFCLCKCTLNQDFPFTRKSYWFCYHVEKVSSNSWSSEKKARENPNLDRYRGKHCPQSFRGSGAKCQLHFRAPSFSFFRGGPDWDPKRRRGRERRLVCRVDRQMINSAQFVRVSMYKGAFRKSKCKKNKTSQFFKVERAQMNPRTFLGACTRLLVQIPRLWNAQE